MLTTLQTIADVVEAILAASFLSGGHEAALQTARRLQIPLPGVGQWSDFARLAIEHATKVADSLPYAPLPPAATVDALQRIIGVSFSRPDLLGQALVGSFRLPSSFGR